VLIDQVVVKELLLFQPIFQKVMPELFYLLLGNRNGRLLIRGFFFSFLISAYAGGLLFFQAASDSAEVSQLRGAPGSGTLSGGRLGSCLSR